MISISASLTFMSVDGTSLPSLRRSRGRRMLGEVLAGDSKSPVQLTMSDNVSVSLLALLFEELRCTDNIEEAMTAIFVAFVTCMSSCTNEGEHFDPC